MTSNPMMNSKVVENVILDSKPMTIQGSINKTLILTGIVALSGLYTWDLMAKGFMDKANLFIISSLVIGLILAIVTAFNPRASKITAPAYALCEGLLAGAVSYAYNSLYNGIVVNAVVLTLLVLFTMLFLYKARVIQATEKFRQVILISTIAIAIFYAIGMIGAFFGHPMTVFNGSVMGIVISVVICAIAALNFILDFDFVEQGEKRNLPDYFEWYCAFSLLVTLIWLYFEILRLLVQLQRRD